MFSCGFFGVLGHVFVSRGHHNRSPRVGQIKTPCSGGPKSKVMMLAGQSPPSSVISRSPPETADHACAPTGITPPQWKPKLKSISAASGCWWELGCRPGRALPHSPRAFTQGPAREGHVGPQLLRRRLWGGSRRRGRRGSARSEQAPSEGHSRSPHFTRKPHVDSFRGVSHPLPRAPSL